jgi:hypothetical protein
MSVQESLTDIVRAAYDCAQQEFLRITALSLQEREAGPTRLMAYVKALVNSGERDPQRICHSALCLMRGHEQLNRSKERVGKNAEIIFTPYQPES